MISVKFGVRYRGVVDGSSNYRAFFSGQLTAHKEQEIRGKITKMYGLSAIITIVEIKEMHEAVLSVGEAQ